MYQAHVMELTDYTPALAHDGYTIEWKTAFEDQVTQGALVFLEHKTSHSSRIVSDVASILAEERRIGLKSTTKILINLKLIDQHLSDCVAST